VSLFGADFYPTPPEVAAEMLDFGPEHHFRGVTKMVVIGSGADEAHILHAGESEQSALFDLEGVA
jgi:hypothetical protein